MTLYHGTNVEFDKIDLLMSSVGVQLWKYETKSIDLPTLVRNLHYMKGVTIQYYFGTERAINLLKRV